MKMENKEKKLIWQVGSWWLVVALFFLHQYILRVALNPLVNELRMEFNLTADQFGQLGAYYLYAYALLQIPLGFIVDRIGVKKTVIGALIIYLGGIYLLTVATTFSVAKISRILMGVGSAAAFMCSLKIVTDRLPAAIRGYFLGATLALGTIGALIAGKPLVALIDAFGWRSALQIVAIFGVPLIALVYFILPKRDPRHVPLKQATMKMAVKDLWGILRNSRIMLYAFLAIGVYTPLSVLADLWGTAFLTEKFLLTRAEAAHTSTMLYVGLSLGSFILPGLCEKENRLNRTIQVCSVALLVLFAVVLYGPVFDQFQLTILLITLGFFCGAEMMCFSGATFHATPDNSGLTIGVVNTLNMLAGGLLQKAVGVGLDFQWTGQLSDAGLRVYSKEHFVMALSILIVVIGLCAIASLFLKRHRSHKT